MGKLKTVGALASRSTREFKRLITPLQLRWRARPNTKASRANKVFIAGCARSGTTLMQSLMWCFEDIFVHPPEARHTMLYLLDRQETNLVVKRDARSHEDLAKLSAAIGLIYCVRHPFDVLTSSHPQTRMERRFHVMPDRWLLEHNALLKLRKVQAGRDILYVRYEDMIGEPNLVQQRIARQFGLKPIIRFSEDPKNPIRATSIRKWEQNEEYLAYLQGLPPVFLARLRGFCNEFGYDMPVWANS